MGGGCCLNFCRPLKLVVIYAEIKKKKSTHEQYTHLFVKYNLRAQSLGPNNIGSKTKPSMYVTDLFFFKKKNKKKTTFCRFCDLL